MSKTLKPDLSKMHPQSGNHVLVQHGPLKGTTVKIMDYLTNQFQGKSLKSLRDRPDLSPEIDALKGRGHELSEKTVFACVPETPPRYILLDDSEVLIEAAKPKLTSIDGGKDDGATTTTEDSGDAGVSEGLEGRDLSSGESSPEDQGEPSSEGQADSQVGSGPGPDAEPVSRPDQPKVDSGKQTQPKGGKPAGGNKGKSGSTK